MRIPALLSQLFGVLPLAFLGPAGPADPVASVRVAPSYPDQAVRLVAVFPGNIVRVVGHEQPAIEVRWRSPATDRGGAVPRLSEDRNDVLLEVGAEGKGRDIEIAVPYHTSLSLKNQSAGSITVTGLTGNQEIESRFGDILLEEMSGSAVLAAYHGSLKATFLELDDDGANSFITYRGDIALHLPADLGATLSLTLDSVSIDSDFILEGVMKRGPSTHRIGDGKARIDVTLNGGHLTLRARAEGRTPPD